MNRMSLTTAMMSALSSMSSVQRQLQVRAIQLNKGDPPTNDQLKARQRAEETLRRSEQVMNEATVALISMNLDIVV